MLGLNLLHNAEMDPNNNQGEGWDSGSLGINGGVQWNGDEGYFAQHHFLPLDEGKTYRVILSRVDVSVAGAQLKLGDAGWQDIPVGYGACSLDFAINTTASSGALLFRDMTTNGVGECDLAEVREKLVSS